MATATTNEITGPVTFGLGQITNPTPQFAKNIFRIVLYTTAIINVVLDVVTEIPPEVKVIVGKYSIYAVTLTHSISKMFGINADQYGPGESLNDIYKNKR